MKSRGPNVSVLHLRSTSEPWASDTDEERIFFDNGKLNFGMDYEKFFKTFEKHNQFSLDNGYTSINNQQASPSPTHSRNRTCSTASNTDTVADTNNIVKYNTCLTNENKFAEDECYRNDSCGLAAESPRRLSREREERDRAITNNQRRENNFTKVYSNYPIISPPPGFEDDILFNENSNQYNILAKNSRDYSSALRTSSPHRGEYGTRNSLYRKNIPAYNRKQDKYSICSYYNGSDVHNNKDLTEYRSVTSCNPTYHHRVYSKEYLPNDQNVVQNSSEKLSPEYYDYGDEIDCSSRNGSAVVPGRSYSMKHSSDRTDICHCNRCCVPLTSLPIHNRIVSSKNNYLSNKNGSRTSMLRNSPSRQRIRRSASFQNGCLSPLYVNLNDYRCDTVHPKNADYRRRRHQYSTVDDDFYDPQIRNALESHPLPESCRYLDCAEIYNTPTYLWDEVAETCTCVLPSNNELSNTERTSDQITSKGARLANSKFKENYPARQADSNKAFSPPPDIATVKSSIETQSENNYYPSYVEFIRKQPDILQSAYCGNTSHVYPDPDEYPTCSHLPASQYLCGSNMEELRKKSYSLPKSFQRNDELTKDFKLSNNSTLFFHWKKYGFRGLFLNKKVAAPSSVMSETAPTTPVRDMPEKKKYGRLMKIGQYSSSPALDDDSMKHINFDCDTKYKKDTYKANHPSSLNSADFRPSSQENIVSGSNLGDRVFHKFCKSFSLRFLRKPSDHEIDHLKVNNDSSPCTDSKISFKPEGVQINRSGPLTWRSNSGRNRRSNAIVHSKYKSRENQMSTESQKSDEREPVQKGLHQQRLVRRTLSDLNQYCTTVNDKNVNATVPIKHKSLVPVIVKKYKQCSLRRSASQPLLNSRYSPAVERKPPPCRTACSEDERALFSEDDMMSDSGGSSLPSRKNSLEQGINEDAVIFAEAVWDHVAIESEELPFNAGDVIEVYNVLDREWWWGMCNGKSGWFPSDFVRLRVNQEESLQNRLSESPTKQNCSLSTYSNEQVRSKIVCELLNTERDFVKVLNDVKEAFISACQDAEELFTAEQIYKIFGNWEQISSFQTTFLETLESNFNEQHPHLSCVGECFLKFREHFRIYSDYCNNHPLSIATLQQLYQKDEYKFFFESCRIKKDMVAIPLDGFLLTPVQRICKYPLQLAELLKHTEADHADHNAVENALNAMREVAILINERKRRMESLEKLILWQQRVEGWEGNNLTENSSQLIHQSDITKVFAGVWSTNVTLFLFDHQLIFCKKDILKRDFYVYKGRISLDGCEVLPIPDGKDTLLGINIRNGLRIQNVEKNKWLLFCCRTQREKQEWLNAFRKEKELVQLDERNKLQITPMDRQLAYITATTCNNRHGFLNHKNKKFKRSVSHNGQYRNTGSPHILGRKVGTWFMFGANRKNHRRFILKNHSNAI